MPYQVKVDANTAVGDPTSSSLTVDDLATNISGGWTKPPDQEARSLRRRRLAEAEATVQPRDQKTTTTTTDDLFGIRGFFDTSVASSFPVLSWIVGTFTHGYIYYEGGFQLAGNPTDTVVYDFRGNSIDRPLPTEVPGHPFDTNISIAYAGINPTKVGDSGYFRMGNVITDNAYADELWGDALVMYTNTVSREYGLTDAVLLWSDPENWDDFVDSIPDETFNAKASHVSSILGEVVTGGNWRPRFKALHRTVPVPSLPTPVTRTDDIIPVLSAIAQNLGAFIVLARLSAALFGYRVTNSAARLQAHLISEWDLDIDTANLPVTNSAVGNTAMVLVEAARELSRQLLDSPGGAVTPPTSIDFQWLADNGVIDALRAQFPGTSDTQLVADGVVTAMMVHVETTAKAMMVGSITNVLDRASTTTLMITDNGSAPALAPTVPMTTVASPAFTVYQMPLIMPTELQDAVKADLTSSGDRLRQIGAVVMQQVNTAADDLADGIGDVVETSATIVEYGFRAGRAGVIVVEAYADAISSDYGPAILLISTITMFLIVAKVVL